MGMSPCRKNLGEERWEVGSAVAGRCSDAGIVVCWACQVTYVDGATVATAVASKSSGGFDLVIPGAKSAADYSGALLSVHLSQGKGACRDAFTGLSPPFTYGALVPSFTAGELLFRWF
jgi:hypothetical protein